MPNTQENREDEYLKLARWERDGKPVLPKLRKYCDDCCGTGSVIRRTGELAYYDCPECAGCAWFPVCDVNVLAQELVSAGFQGTIYLNNPRYAYLQPRNLARYYGEAYGDTLEDALLNAAVALMEKDDAFNLSSELDG